MDKNQSLFKKLLKKIRDFIFHNEVIYKLFTYIISYLFSFYLLILKLTSRISFDFPKDYKFINNKSLIFCFWHGRLLSPIFIRKAVKGNAYVLLSRGKDAGLITVMLKLFKVNPIRGSRNRKSNKGGVSSLKKMIRLLIQENNIIAIAPDGPIGPRMRVAPGIPMLSLTTGAEIIPLTMSAKYNIIFKTWDSFLLPLPFNRIVVKVGEPISPLTKNNNKKFLEDYRKEIEEVLIKLTHKLDEKFKIPIILPVDVDKKNNPLKRKLN